MYEYGKIAVELIEFLQDKFRDAERPYEEITYTLIHTLASLTSQAPLKRDNLINLLRGLELFYNKWSYHTGEMLDDINWWGVVWTKIITDQKLNNIHLKLLLDKDSTSQT